MDEQVVASRAFFIDDEGIAPIDGSASVFLQIATRDGLNLPNAEVAKAYLLTFITCSQTNQDIVARIVEPEGPFPFLKGVDEAVKTEVRSLVEPCKVWTLEGGGYAASGTMVYGGTLARFEATIPVDGQVDFTHMSAAWLPQEGAPPNAIFANYRFTENGWRVLGYAERSGDAQETQLGGGLNLGAEGKSDFAVRPARR